jgi:hypothetical protein
VSDYTMAHDIFNHPHFVACQEHAANWEETHMHLYSEIMCLKDTTDRSRTNTIHEAFNNLKAFINNKIEHVLSRKKTHVCVRRKGHSGNCATGDKTAYVKKVITSNEVLNKISYLYTTPGDDTVVYKNRSSRLFPIALSAALESVIRNKNIKLKCAIPLSEASTPWMIATNYLDYMTLLLNVKGIDILLNINSNEYNEIAEMTGIHKLKMINYFAQYNRKLFDADGYTICPVTRRLLTPEQFTITDRISHTSIQLGHVIPRSNTQYTIRGMNVLFMTRRGNTILGDHSFIDDLWVHELKDMLKHYE